MKDKPLKYCERGEHYVSHLWHSRTKERPSSCKSCLPRQEIKKGVGISHIQANVPNKTMIEKMTPYVEAMDKAYLKYQQLMLKKTTSKTVKPKVIAKVSSKEKKRQVAYMALRKVYMEQNDRCMYKDCQRPSTECHHIRGRGKEYMLDTSEWMAVCNEHHRYIHENDKESRELGYLKSRLGK